MADIIDPRLTEYFPPSGPVFTRYPTAEEEMAVRDELARWKAERAMMEEQQKAAILANELKRIQAEQLRQEMEYRRQLQSAISEALRQAAGGFPAGMDVGQVGGKWVGVSGAGVTPFSKVRYEAPQPAASERAKILQTALLRSAGFDIPYELPSEKEAREMAKQEKMTERLLAGQEKIAERQEKLQTMREKENYIKQLHVARRQEIMEVAKRRNQALLELDRWLSSLLRKRPENQALYKAQKEEIEQEYRDALRRINKGYKLLFESVGAMMPEETEEEVPKESPEEALMERFKSMSKPAQEQFRKMYKAQTGKDWPA